MSWNHRVIAKEDCEGEEYLAIHEVYYNEDGDPKSMTKLPMEVSSQDIKGLKWTIKQMQMCLYRGILNEDLTEHTKK